MEKGRRIRLTGAAATLSRMREDRDFIRFGLELAERALIDLMARDSLQLRPETMPRSRCARASGRLREIERIVRRLIFLMALGLHIVFAPPRRKAAAAPDVPEGVELAVFPGVAEPRFALVPPAQRPDLSGHFPDMSRSFSGQPGPVSTARLLARIRAVWRVLKAPEAAAKRLARSIQRLKATGAPRPVAGPAESAFRLGPELGALATALPGLLNARLEAAWNDSG